MTSETASDDVATRFEACLPLLLVHEGGYVDNPNDPGGATNLGVTLNAWTIWTGHAASKDDIRALTPATVAPLYEANYWGAVSADQLPPGVDYICFDTAVNQGPLRARKWLQTAVRVDPDGIIGPATLAAVGASGAPAIINRIGVLREAAYRALPTFAEFGRGWLNRLSDVTRQALAMAS